MTKLTFKMPFAKEAQLPATDKSLDDLKARIAQLEQENFGLRKDLDQMNWQATTIDTNSDTKLGRVLSKISTLEDVLERQFKAIKNKLGDERANGLNPELLASYLDLLEGSLTGTLNRDRAHPHLGGTFSEEMRELGRDWPETALTMIGTARMRHLRRLVESVITENIEGDLIETGVWRGGASIYMRGILKAYGVTDRKVWVADSFEGLPPPNEAEFPADKGDPHHKLDALAVPLEEVRDSFTRYGLLDDQVEFLKGWFKDTLDKAPIERLAILRFDGDMYESTIQALNALYHKVVPGGYVIIDDYILMSCRQAVHDFREKHAIVDPIREIDACGVFWRKS